MAPEERGRHLVKILRTREIADRLGISVRTLYNWERDGRLPPRRKIGPAVRGLREDELEAWLEARPEVGAAEERR